MPVIMPDCSGERRARQSALALTSRPANLAAMHAIATANTILLLGSALILAGILSSLIATRFGAPMLLLFLGIGMLAGEDGPGGLAFSDYSLSNLIGSLAPDRDPVRTAGCARGCRRIAACSRRRCSWRRSASSSRRRCPASSPITRSASMRRRASSWAP